MRKITVLIAFALIVLGACNTGKRVSTSPEGSSEAAFTGSEINPDPAHNSRNSVDWAGVYRGVIPCADCPGIEDEIRLNDDLTFERLMVYQERDSRFAEKGRFEWDNTGGKIRLINEESPDQGGNWFRVGENRLIMLDIEGNPIDNNIPAEMYVYQKMDLDHVITEKYWKLMELNGKAIPPVEKGRREAHFILKNQDNRVTGSTGCNNLMGSFELSGSGSMDDSRIGFSPMATTRMACVDVNYEQEFLNVFEDCDRYSIQNDTLTLIRETVPLARFAAIYLR